MWQGVLWCLVIAAVYVSCLYLKHTPASRQHPETVKWRMLSVVIASSVSWIPVWMRYKQALRGAEHPEAAPTLMQLLGLHPQATLLADTLLALSLTAVLFAGPLLYMAVTAREELGQASHSSNWHSSLYIIRDCVVAPLSEEWCFRACMVPLLSLEGMRPRSIILVAPLFFGVCHLHHARELVLVQGWSITQAVLVVCFQLVYTTLFGWFATWSFLNFGHLAAPAAVHAFCNFVGLPPFRKMAAHHNGRVLMAATITGVIAFGILLSRVAREGCYPSWWIPS